MEFNNELQRLRKERGLSQEELGEKLGVSRQTISKWENGSAYPDMLNLMTISEFFGVTADELINGKKEEVVPEITQDEQNESENVPTIVPETSVTVITEPEKQSSFHFEYRSKTEIRGMPLVHINYGLGDYRARGIISVGNASTGILAVGILARGLISVGIISLGLLGIGVLSLAAFAVACVGVGIISVAGIAIGVMTLGGLALGVVSIGGCAVATHVSVGGVAIAPVSVGFIVNGEYTVVLRDLQDISQVTAEQINSILAVKFPNLPFFLRDWATLLFM